MQTFASSEAFLSNFMKLKNKMRDPLPTDVIIFQCDHCNSNLPLNVDGVLLMDEKLDKEISILLDESLKSLQGVHHEQCKNCTHAKMHIHPVFGTPTNVILSFPESEEKFLSSFKIGGDCYNVEIKVTQMISDNKAIFVLFQNENAAENIYTDFIKCNFESFLNIESNETDGWSEQDWIYDDESVSRNQQILPRIIGGGRALGAEFNYICLWCPKEDLLKGNKGKYRELKNYRDHFKKYHHGEDGNGVPMSDFLKKVQRCEPTWFCQNCKQHQSLGNAIRHKAICKPTPHLDSSDSEFEENDVEDSQKDCIRERQENRRDESEAIEDEDIQNTRNRERQKKIREESFSFLDQGASGSNTAKQKDDRILTTVKADNSLDDEVRVNKQSEEERVRKRYQAASGSNIAIQSDADHIQQNIALGESGQKIDNPISLNQFEVAKGQAEARKQKYCNDVNIDRCLEKEKNTSKRINLDASHSSDEEQNNNQRIKSRKKRKSVNIEDVHDELLTSEEEEEIFTRDLLEIKVELIDDTDHNPNDLANKKDDNLNKWWLKVPKHLYNDRGLGGPKIFLPSDSTEFVKRATESWQIHQTEKSDLDKKMKITEAGEAQLHQLSFERDQPILDKYTDFVHTFSAKDVMHIFSEDYEEMDIPTGAKSSTAKQYKNRIIEFFKFMAANYHNFHLDWMLDYQGTIEKTLTNGSVNKEIFLPTKKDLTDFIKQFKYGSNPAANCGLRIFAIKKLMDFISQEIKDNEHEFIGGIVEKSRIVECLVQKIRNLNEGICPDGTIKNIKTASNKNHKRTLIEQLAKCPERNMSSIMKGVTEYVDSEEHAIQKTILIELACKKTKIPTNKEYMNSTNWLLEQLICLGGNRPCALLGITLRDWAERRPGYCPFFQDDDNDVVAEDPEYDNRKVLQNPYKKPKGSTSDEPTGVIVQSETDKIAVGPPCYIWFPNALVDLVNNHSLIAQKVLPRSTDIYHPKTRLFLNSNGKPLTKIECNHFKNYIGLPITAYDFRRSLSTFCLDSKNETIRSAESSVLRHREETGFAYYYQKHSQKVEYVNIQYALKNGLIKAEKGLVDEYCTTLRKCAANDEWELSQKRTDKALEYSQDIIRKRKESLNGARQKGGRNWILPAEYDAFIEGIEEAIKMEENRLKTGYKPGPFYQLLKYKPEAKDAGIFPAPGIWLIDMYRVLYGLRGEKGDAMRRAELSVYDGKAFSTGLSGRKKIEAAKEKNQDADLVVANYWRDKIKDDAKQTVKGKWLPLRFIFTEKELDYHKEYTQKNVKSENE